MLRTINSLRTSLPKQGWASILVFRNAFGCSNQASFPGYNINKQQHRAYINKVERQQQVEQQELIDQSKDTLPRRKRRVYDRPRVDNDIADYAVWRVFEADFSLTKMSKHSLNVLARLQVSPKWLKHAFGIPLRSMHNIQESTGEYYFEDNYLSQYILYEEKSTTYYKPNDPDWNYEDQSMIEPRKRKIFRPTPEEFWNSEEPHEFKLNGSTHAHHHKFIRWIMEEVEKRKSGPSYDEIVDGQFGKAYTFNKPEDKALFTPKEPMIMYASVKHFDDSKVEQTKASTDVVPKKSKKDKGDKDKAVATDNVTSASQAEQAIVVPEIPVVKNSDVVFAKRLQQKYRTNQNVSAIGMIGEKAADKGVDKQDTEVSTQKKSKKKKERKD